MYAHEPVAMRTVGGSVRHCQYACVWNVPRASTVLDRVERTEYACLRPGSRPPMATDSVKSLRASSATATVCTGAARSSPARTSISSASARWPCSHSVMPVWSAKPCMTRSAAAWLAGCAMAGSEPAAAPTSSRSVAAKRARRRAGFCGSSETGGSSARLMVSGEA